MINNLKQNIMKAKFENNEKNREIKTLPCLMHYNKRGCNFVVLALGNTHNGDFRGVVISADCGSYEIGHESNGWEIKQFSVLSSESSVILKND